MTQLSPKPGSQHFKNGRGSYSKATPVDGRTSATNYSSSASRRGQSSLESKAIQFPSSEEILPYAQTPKLAVQQRNWLRWLSASLRVKTTLAAIAIGALPVITIGAVSYLTSSQQFRQQIIQNEQTNILDLKDKLFYFMKERAGDAETLSNLPVFIEPKLREVFKREDQEDALNRFARAYQIYDSIALVDLQGNVLAQSQSETLPNLYNQDYFQAVLKTDRLYISEPAVSVSSKVYSLFVAAPVKDAVTGKTIAIIRTRIPMTAVRDIFGVKSQRGQQFFLVDASGKVAVSDADEPIGKKLEEVFPTLPSKVTRKDLEAQESKSIVGPHNEAQGQQEDVITYTLTNRIREAYNLNWSFALARTTEIAFATEQQLLWTLVTGTGIATVLVGAIAAIIASRATRPILEAANAVEKIGQGDLDTRVDIQGEDELAVLGANINDMAGQLELFTQEQKLAAEQALLVAKVTGSRTNNAQELEELFRDIIDEARQILNVDRVIIYRFKPDLSGYIAAESVVSGFPRAFSNKTEDFYLSELRDISNPEDLVIALDNIFEANLDTEHLELLRRWQVKSKVDVPILHEGQPYGMLIAHYCSEPHEWQETEVNFLKQLAAQMGLSLDRVLLLEETEKLASEQRNLKEGLQNRALELLKEVDPISKGDLTIRARVTADEIGTIADSYNATVGNLRKIVEQVQHAATQVAETTITNEATVQSLSIEALRQAEQIAQALDKAQQMAESVRQVAENAQQAEIAVRQAAETVEEGDAAMNRTVDGILAIRETVAETAKKVKHLGESSQKISTVVNLISTFAAQTNLLALNASIEAARAGEEGRGFAVVADEVRALARQSAEATSEIEKLVAAIQAETNEVVAAMEAGTEQVVTGTKLVDETRNSLNKITTASLQINKLVAEITQATVVQSQASEAVTQTMTNVASIADKTSKEAGFVSSAFEQLLQVAQTLQEDVGQFKLG